MGDAEDPGPKHPETDHLILSLARDEVAKVREAKELSDAESTANPIGSFNFGGKNLHSLPEELAEIIKDDAQRLALDKNHLTGLSGISHRMGEFKQLQYLVLRNNQLEEFPRAVLSVLTLETLDLRNNRIEYLPEDLAKLQNLKTLSIFHNNVKKFPLCIGQMHTLSYIQSRKNPIEFPPPSQWRTSIRTPDNEVEDRERDIAETDRLKRILRDFAKTQRSKNDSADDTSEASVETPKPSRRKMGGRFPIRPSVSGPDLNGSLASLSPAPASRPVPLHTKSTSRIPAAPGPATSTLRPTLNPLMLGNERSRSSSESQMSTSKRKKRMGMQMSRGSKGSDQQELENLALEAKRLSHLRGVSHGMRLQSEANSNQGLNASLRNARRIPEPPKTASIVTTSRTSHVRGMGSSYSATPRYKDPIFELSDSMLFVLEQYHPHFEYVIGVLRQGHRLPGTLERAFRDAMTAQGDLKRALAAVNEFGEERDTYVVSSLRESNVTHLRQPINDAIRNIDQVGKKLFTETENFVKKSDPRRIRVLLFGIHAGNIEKTNALNRFYNRTGIPLRLFLAGIESHREILSGQCNAKLSVSNGHSVNRTTSPSPRPRTSIKIPSKDELSGTHSLSNGSRPQFQSPINGVALPSSKFPQAHDPFVTAHKNGVYHSPKRSIQISPMTSMGPSQLEKLFDDVSLALHRGCCRLIEALPSIKQYYSELNVQTRELPAYDLQLFHRLNQKRVAARNSAISLQIRLESMSGQDSDAREDPETWQLIAQFCTNFGSFCKLIQTRTAPNQGLPLAPSFVRENLKPVARAIGFATRKLESSPWEHYLYTNWSQEGVLPRSLFRQFSLQSPPPLTLQTPVNGGSFDSTETASSTGNHSATSSGFVTPLPATPISAVLGPAASATVPGGSQSSSGSNASGIDRSRSVSSRR